MILKTAYYNSGTSSHSALAAESNHISYIINHEFNAPAQTTVILADATGAMARKYDVALNSVYVGPGRAYLEDPDATCLFNGRILRARHNTISGRVTLQCADWLHQLDEKRIDYDMREDLDGNGLRQGTVSSPVHDERLPVKVVGAAKYMYDDGMGWALHKWTSDYYLVFSNAMAGKQTIGAGPYSRTVIGDAIDDESYTDDIGDLWADDSAVHTCVDSDDYIIYYYTHPIIVTESAFYVAGSISGARLHITYSLHSSGGDDVTHAWVFASNDGGPPFLGTLAGTDGEIKRQTLEVPADSLSSLIDANGWGYSYFTVRQEGTDTVTWKVYHAWLEIDVETTGDNAAIFITGSGADYIATATDLTLANANYGIWEGCPYSFVKKAFHHIDSEEGGTLITGGDDLMELTCAGTIEHTDGISTRHYSGRTRLEILKDIAHTDKAVFFIPLGSTTVTWKSTFEDGSPTEITDASVIAWSGGQYDYEPMRNEYRLSGVRIGDNQLFVDTSDLSPDPGADSKSKYGVTRSDSIKNTGTTSIYETESLGKALVERDEDVHLLLRATLAGLSSIRLGDELNINSTLLGLTDEKYVVTHWSYNSATHHTIVRLHPRTSTQGYIRHITAGEYIRKIADVAKQAQLDTHAPDLYKQTWS